MSDTTSITYGKYSKGFWIDLADRTISSGAGAALALATAVSFDLLKPDVAGIAAVVGTAMVISVLKALAVLKVTNTVTVSVDSVEK